MKKLLIIAIITAAFALHADTVFFRSGIITAAEITSASVKISGLDPLAFPALPENRLYAVLSVKIASGRTISIFDYSLEFAGITYPCVAINRGNGFISAARSFDGGTSCQLLFIIDNRPIKSVEKLLLKCNLPPTDGTYDIAIAFKNIRRATPTAISKIPAAGLLERK